MTTSSGQKSPAPSPMDRGVVILSGIVISALGAMFYNLLPLFLGAAQDSRGLGNEAIGIMGSAFYVGFTLTTLTAFFWIRRLSWRRVTLLVIPLAAVSMLAAGFLTNQVLMLVSIFVSGSAFSALYGIGVTLMADTSQPARWYGLKIACEAGLGAILLLILPGLVIAQWGYEGLMVGMTVTLLILTPLLHWLPASGGRNEDQPAEHSPPPVAGRLRNSIGLSVTAVMMFLFGITMIWAFVERMANDAGFDPVTTGNVLSLTLVFAVSGSLLAMLLGGRFGAAKPLAAACLMLLISLVLLGGVDTITDYTIGACLFSLAFGLGVPCVVTVTADLDIDGRYVVLTVPAMGFGVMIAPASAGFLISAYGHAGVLWGGGLAVGATLVLVLLALKLGLHIALAERGRIGLEAPEPML